MALEIGNNVTSVLYNGNPVTSIVYNGVTVWTVNSPTPPTPSIDYSKEYLTLTPWEDSCTFTIFLYSGVSANMSYSYDKSTWTSLSYNTNTITVNKGVNVYLKGSNYRLANSDNYSRNCYIRGNKLFEVSGNIMSLIWSDDFEGKTNLINGGSDTFAFFALFDASSSNPNKILTARNMVLPCTQYTTKIYQSLFSNNHYMLYAPKELPQQESQGSNTLVWMFANCYALQETPVVRLTNYGSGDSWRTYILSQCTGLKRTIFLVSSNYPSMPSSVNPIKYKSSSNTYSTGTVRVFSENSSDYVHIWGESEIPYACYASGFSDYYQVGDEVTLVATAINGATFAGWYEGGTLVSSNATYTFTSSVDRNLIMKTT